jgi:hypothetical protein
MGGFDFWGLNGLKVELQIPKKYESVVSYYA